MTGSRVSWRWMAGLAVTALLLAGAAHAQDPRARFSAAGQVGASSYGMKDVNDRIADGNAFLAGKGYKKLGRITYGWNFTYDVRARVKGPLSVSVGGGTTMGKAQIEFDQILTVKPKAPFYHALALYRLPFRPIPTMILRLGGGAVYTSKATAEIRHEFRTVEGGTNRIETVTVDGKGLGARAFIEAEMVLNEKVTLVADLGYRRLKISDDNWDWKVDVPRARSTDLDQDDIPNQWDLNDTSPNSPTGRDIPSWLTTSFLQVQYGPNGRPEIDGATGRPNVDLRPSGGLDMDFSGVLANVGLRFHIF